MRHSVRLTWLSLLLGAPALAQHAKARPDFGRRVQP